MKAFLNKRANNDRISLKIPLVDEARGMVSRIDRFVRPGETLFDVPYATYLEACPGEVEIAHGKLVKAVYQR